MKKILLAMGAIALTLAIVPMFAAFEAHVINVTAMIENALSVDTTPIEFGTVFPEEYLVRRITLGMSGSFASSTNADDIKYVIKQKPKCMDTQGNYVPVDALTHQCPEGAKQLPLLCPYLSKTDADPQDGNDGPNILPFHPATTTTWGYLAKSDDDMTDLWDIDLRVPCFKGSCAQDNVVPVEYQLDPAMEHETFGCDLWIEVTGISRLSQPQS